MIIRDGNGFSTLIEFPNGAPDGNVVWRLLGPGSTQLNTGSITVPNGAVSIFINVSGTDNTIPVGDLTSYRDLVWSYTVGGQTINGERRYTIEARLPYGVSPDGVRRKLGSDADDLPDSEISLIAAYLSFESTVTEAVLVTGSATSVAIRDAIEALSALALIPTMSVRVAKKEDSGTSSFQRQDVDWELVRMSLEDYVNRGILELIPTYDPTANFESLFIVVGQETDAFTGETA